MTKYTDQQLWGMRIQFPISARLILHELHFRVSVFCVVYLWSYVTLTLNKSPHGRCPVCLIDELADAVSLRIGYGRRSQCCIEQDTVCISHDQLILYHIMILSRLNAYSVIIYEIRRLGTRLCLVFLYMSELHITSFGLECVRLCAKCCSCRLTAVLASWPLPEANSLYYAGEIEIWWHTINVRYHVLSSVAQKTGSWLLQTEKLVSSHLVFG